MTQSDTLATGEATTTAINPVGSWAVTVTFTDGTTERGLFAFTRDQLLICTTTGSKQTGVGVWRPTANGFRFAFREQAFDDDGSFMFDVHVDQRGTITGDTFSTNGTGTAYDADGNQIQSVQTTLTGKRYTFDS